jgi:hypothetical protein
VGSSSSLVLGMRFEVGPSGSCCSAGWMAGGAACRQPCVCAGCVFGMIRTKCQQGLPTQHCIQHASGMPCFRTCNKLHRPEFRCQPGLHANLLGSRRSDSSVPPRRTVQRPSAQLSIREDRAWRLWFNRARSLRSSYASLRPGKCSTSSESGKSISISIFNFT